MKAYSSDLRQRITAAVHEGQEVIDVAERYGVHPRTVWRYLQLELERLLPGARRVVVEGAGHEMFLDEPTMLARTVLEHISRHQDRYGLSEPVKGRGRSG